MLLPSCKQIHKRKRNSYIPTGCDKKPIKRLNCWIKEEVGRVGPPATKILLPWISHYFYNYKTIGSDKILFFISPSSTYVLLKGKNVILSRRTSPARQTYKIMNNTTCTNSCWNVISVGIRHILNVPYHQGQIFANISEVSHKISFTAEFI